MSDKPEAPEHFSLSRWSRRKLEVGMDASTAAPASAAARPALAAPAVAPELPSVESLTFDSNFTAFFRPEVDEKLKRAALKQLFRDPRFNVMDGLDVYIDDYTKADPIPPNMLADLMQRFTAVARTETEETPAPQGPDAAPTWAGAQSLLRGEGASSSGEPKLTPLGESSPAEPDASSSKS